MPVVQPYRASKTQTVKSSLQEITYEEAADSDPVSKRKQLQAFPPNFIHSLDSAHMMLSAIKSDQQGLIFSSVHDSFWTHAADIPVMNEILRDAFVEMHQEDIVGRLREEMVKRYADYLHLAPIDKTSALGESIRDLRKSKGRRGKWADKSVVSDEPSSYQIDELLEEHERQRLLKSDDPEERRKGEEMVTPGSLFDAAEEAETLPVMEEKDVQLLGSRVGDSANVMMASVDAEDANVPDSEGVEMLAEDDDTVDSIAIDELMDEVQSRRTRGKAKSKTKSKRESTEASDEGVDDEYEIAEADVVDELEEATSAQKEKKKPNKRLHIWLPLRFPATPPKGEFDVKDLKNSAYFFS
jgi:DNA-directed RNA polymerase